MPRPPDPDRLLIAKLAGVAGRHARQDAPTDEAVAEILTLVKGRRNAAELLAQVAGTALGAAETAPWPPWKQRTAELCIAAGADETLMPAVAAEVAARLRGPLPVAGGIPERGTGV